MSYEYNHDDTLINHFPNPFQFENVFLFFGGLATAVGGIAAMITAKDLFENHDDKVASIAAAVAALVLGVAVKLLIQALSQVRFYLGRKFPLGLAGELQVTETGVGRGTEQILETLRHRTIAFPEPHGALSGVLYSMMKNLATSPIEVQAAAVEHFHSLIAMLSLFASLLVSFFVFAGAPYEGFVSWLYLPMTGLSLVTPFLSPGRLDVQVTEKPQAVETDGKALWTLMGLAVFSIMAPVMVPRIAPHIEIAPMWIAPALLLVGSLGASALFFCAIVSRLDSAAQTNVSCEQTTVAMNCAPAQLWTAISRDFQNSWQRGIPNRAYANVPPEVSEGARGSFGGFVLEESQPMPISTLQFSTWVEALQTQHSRFLLLLGAWGVVMATGCGWATAEFTAQFATMTRMEISRSLLIVIALGMAAVLSFRIGHLLWSRMHFKSRIFWIETSGTYQTSQISVGNQLRGSALSSSTLIRVQDATLRVWVADVDSVVFGKDGKRSIIALASADSVAKEIADRLIDFAAKQSSIATPTATRDLSRAASIGALDASVRAATRIPTSSGRSGAIRTLPAEEQANLRRDARVEGRVKFYDAAKLYGYIVAYSGDEYFFNSNSFRGDAPHKGDRVQFWSELGPKGLIAKQVQVTTNA